VRRVNYFPGRKFIAGASAAAFFPARRTGFESVFNSHRHIYQKRKIKSSPDKLTKPSRRTTYIRRESAFETFARKSESFQTDRRSYNLRKFLRNERAANRPDRRGYFENRF
jgi:hypothetical protein